MKSLLIGLVLLFSACEGPVGPQGKQGTPGINGTSGIDGVDGNDGRDGNDGIDGIDGLDGVAGIISRKIVLNASAWEENPTTGTGISYRYIDVLEMTNEILQEGAVLLYISRNEYFWQQLPRWPFDFALQPTAIELYLQYTFDIPAQSRAPEFDGWTLRIVLIPPSQMDQLETVKKVFNP